MTARRAHPTPHGSRDGGTRARAFAEFARLGQDLNQSTLAEMLGVSRARVHTLFKIWKGIKARRLYSPDSIDSTTARVVDGGNGSRMPSNAERPERVPNQEDARSLDASTVDSIIDEAILAGLDLTSMHPLKARQLLAAAESCRRGSPPVHALMAAGVGRTAAYAWLKDPKVRDFFDAQDGRFVGVATSRLYDVIMTGPAHAAVAAIQFGLERRFPEFNKKDRLDIHAELESEISVQAILSSEETILLAGRLETFWQMNPELAGQIPAGIELRDGAYRQLPAASKDELPPGVVYDTTAPGVEFDPILGRNVGVGELPAPEDRDPSGTA